ncbi:MAG TPA: hypothetical protein VKF15_08000 [Nitrososphaerales archaeon]|nr:hypothetical protein [Nitrososphaerales archaeon]
MRNRSNVGAPRPLAMLFAGAIVVLLVAGQGVVHAQSSSVNSTTTTSTGGFTVRPATFDLGSAAVAILVFVLLGLAAALVLIARWTSTSTRSRW